MILHTNELILTLLNLKNTSAPAVEDALVELAQMAGFFMVTLVEQLEAFSDGVNEVRTYHIHVLFLVLTKSHREMNQVLEVVNKISSQRSPLSGSDKAAIDDCNRRLTLACGMFGVRKPTIRSCQILINQIRFELGSSHKKPLLSLRPS